MASEQVTVRFVTGAALLGSSGFLARSRLVSATERRVFERLNSGIGVAERPVWAVMQMGNGLTAVVAPAVLLGLGRPTSEAVRVGSAAFGAWQLAKAVKRALPRGRPNSLLDDVVLRDGNPAGGGFVSGHATVATATAVAIGSTLGPSVQRTAGATAFVVALARVHVGAHLPLDVIGGVGLGLIWGSLCASLPVPRRPGAGS